MEENIAGKEEMADYQYFFLFHNVFKRPLPWVVKTQDCVKEIKPIWSNNCLNHAIE